MAETGFFAKGGSSSSLADHLYSAKLCLILRRTLLVAAEAKEMGEVNGSQSVRALCDAWGRSRGEWSPSYKIP